MTNYEKIKSMTIEDMAIYHDKMGGCALCGYHLDIEKCNKTNCVDAHIKWLESESEVDQ